MDWVPECKPASELSIMIRSGERGEGDMSWLHWDVVMVCHTESDIYGSPLVPYFIHTKYLLSGARN